ncbi:ABC-type cobalamin/Fe3+-siderophore transport system, ATpase component [Clostridium aceticum]|uniref:ABC-type cobalamin/Fe3+-siderophore transport system, ATpase component n=1 Tax=Clostridium aceticum TaxID=84022 RepID=A0A0D8IBT4_9CLOT|nr:ABC transporter ATP-binding protein [Clostridium aceticum]AKL96558.1 ABC-type cobalamin/Fe3+-siderophore transport system, ATpase component [Clostridium aceticum]KJF27407.1 iron ABC transporter [Clostridium aceticum]
MLIMELSKIRISYENKEVLKDVSAVLRGGQLISVIGSNGVGKTTLIKAIAGLVKFQGSIEIKMEEGERISSKEIAYVPQIIPAFSDLTVFEMVLLGRVKDLSWKVEQAHLNEVTKVLNELELMALSCRSFSKLSEGEKQLVILAQALVSNPKVLLLDEPTSTLDIRHQLQVLNIAQSYSKTTGAITITALHDLALAARYSDYMILLNGGYSLKQGDPYSVVDPDLLEKAYKVEVEVGLSTRGYTTITPIRLS